MDIFAVGRIYPWKYRPQVILVRDISVSGHFAFGIFQSKDVLALGHFVPRTFRPGTLRSWAVSVAEMFRE